MDERKTGERLETEEQERTRSSSNYLNLDANKVLTAFGKFGRYQMMTYMITNSVHLFFAANMMVMPFITEMPKFDCDIKPPENTYWDYTVIDSCTILDCNNWTISCLNIPDAKYVYEYKRTSIASEFDLVCEHYDSVEHGSSVFLLGGMLVAPLITQLSDLFGRRVTFLIPLYVAVFSNMICAAAPNYTSFLIFRFLAGVATTSFSTIGGILALESVSIKFRNYLPIMSNITWVLGYLLAGVLKLFINDWRWLYFAVSLPGLITIPYYWFTPESIHWLITKRKDTAVKKYIATSMRFNRCTIELHECRTHGYSETGERRVKKRTAVDIFTTPALFVNLIVNSYILIVMSLTYWALSLFSTDLSDDKMTGFFLSGFIEVPAALIAFAMIFYFNRKTVSFVALIMQTLSMLAAVFSPQHSVWIVLFPLVAKCFNAVVWSSQPLLYSEATPTSVRNVFTGLVGFLGDLGSVMAPYIKRLEAIDKRAPSLLIAGMSLVAAMLVLALPETRDKELAEDIDDDAYDPGPLLRCFMARKEKAKKNQGTPMITLSHGDETTVLNAPEDLPCDR